MTRAIQSSALVIAALWVGILFCLGFVVTPYLFALAARGNAVVPHSGAAAELIGPLLYGSDVLGLVAGAVLIAALVVLRRRGAIPLGGRFYLGEVGVLAASLCAAVNYWGLAPRIKAAQLSLAEKYGAFHQADRADSLYLQFQSLHQASTTVFLLGPAAAFLCLVCLTHVRSRPGRPTGLA